MAKKQSLSAEQIAADIRENEKHWWISGYSQSAVKKHLRGKYNCTINQKVFAETMSTVGKYYGVLKKKPKSAQTVLDNDAWDRLKSAVESLWSELTGLTLPQGYELIRTRLRTNKVQLAGLPSRLHYWNNP